MGGQAAVISQIRICIFGIFASLAVRFRAVIKWTSSKRARYLCELLAELREAVGKAGADQLTQEAVGARLGASQGYVSEYEAGQRQLTIFRLEAVAAALNVAPIDVLTRFETTAPPEVVVVSSSVERDGNKIGNEGDVPALADDEEYTDAVEQARALQLGQLLKRHRRAAGLTQGGLAELVGERQWWVSRYERAKIKINLIQMDQLATALGTTLPAVVEEFWAISPPC